MRGGPWQRILTSTPSPAALFLTLHLILAGCASQRVIAQKGESGPIAWEVTDIRQSLEEQGNRMRWNYTFVLRNTGSATVNFDQMTVVSTPLGAGNFSGGHSTQRYVQTLKPGAEIREARSFSHGCNQNCDPQWVRQMLRAGVMQSVELRGRDDAGRTVTAVVRFRLDSSVGASAAAPPPVSVAPTARQVPIREIGQIAGKWRGTILGPGSPPATVTIEPDGKYSWLNDRESGAGTLTATGDGRALFESTTGRRGTVTLHEDGGGRRLTVDFAGASWKGALTPVE
jgi:hypothetical protein